MLFRRNKNEQKNIIDIFFHFEKFSINSLFRFIYRKYTKSKLFFLKKTFSFFSKYFLPFFTKQNLHNIIRLFCSNYNVSMQTLQVFLHFGIPFMSKKRQKVKKSKRISRYSRKTCIWYSLHKLSHKTGKKVDVFFVLSVNQVISISPNTQNPSQFEKKIQK